MMRLFTGVALSGLKLTVRETSKHSHNTGASANSTLRPPHREPAKQWVNPTEHERVRDLRTRRTNRKSETHRNTVLTLVVGLSGSPYGYGGLFLDVFLAGRGC